MCLRRFTSELAVFKTIAISVLTFTLTEFLTVRRCKTRLTEDLVCGVILFWTQQTFLVALALNYNFFTSLL
jgi:hypothetical protein